MKPPCPRLGACARSLALACLLPFLASGCSVIYRSLGGAFCHEPEDLERILSPGAMRLVTEALGDLDPASRIDYHVHMISPDFHPSWLSWLHPIRRARTMVFLSASGTDFDSMLEQYASRLERLIRGVPGGYRVLLYALDWYYSEDGTRMPEKSTIHISNELVYQVHTLHPDLFVPVVSIHPARPDAIDELEKWSARGCRHVKWLPNSMGINPSLQRYDEFYRKMRDLGMILLCHTGEESAVEATASQQLGNPLLLRRPLDLGVRIVALHAASDGSCKDLDDPDGGSLPAFDLLMRLFDDPKYDGLLFADTASITFFNHLERPLRILLERPDLQRRLVHGSDYPFCAVNIALRTSSLARHGFIDEQEGELLNEIYDCNPLLFDLVVKRTIHHPKTGARLAPGVFAEPAGLSVTNPQSP